MQNNLHWIVAQPLMTYMYISQNLICPYHVVTETLWEISKWFLSICNTYKNCEQD